MNVLAINCGSSSIKWGIFTTGWTEDVAPLRDGRLKAGSKGFSGEATLHFEAAGAELPDTTEPVPDHDEGVRRITKWLAATQLPVEAVGHVSWRSEE